MKKFRKSLFLRGLCHTLIFAIFFISCDPNGSSIVDNQLDKQAEIALEDYGSFMSERDCENFAEMVDAVKGFVWLSRQGGQNPSQEAVSNFVYDLHVKKGLIKYDKEDKDAMAEIASSGNFMGDHEQLIQNLLDEKSLTSEMADIMLNFTNDFDEVKSFDEGFEMIAAYQQSDLIENLDETEKVAWEKAMTTAETGLCYEMESTVGDNKDWCQECVWELNWVKVIISIVITIIVWIFAFFTFGLSLLFSFVISVAVWTVVWVLHCFWVECDPPAPCPDGQEPFCHTGFELNLEEGLCKLDDIYKNATINNDNCIKVDKLPNGNCPGEAVGIPGLDQCILFCFGPELPESFGMEPDGTFIYPFLCL